MTRHSLSPTKQQRLHDAAYWGLLLVACAVFYWMNVLTPFKEDDMGFTLIDGVWTPVHSLGDAVQSFLNHFTNTNGRLSEAVPMLFAGLLGKPLFNIINTLVFALLIHLLSLLSTRRCSVMVQALFLAVVGTCYPVPGETMLWMAGSANYMWAITLSLLLVWWLQRQEGKPLRWHSGLLLLALAVIAGGFNEATSLGFLAGLILHYVFNRRQFNRRAAVALTGYLIGVLIIVASPAAWSRATSGDIVMNLPLGDLLQSRWFIFKEKTLDFLVPIAALAVGIITLLMKRGGVVHRSMWTYIFLCLTLVMMALGLRHERAYAPWVTVAFLIVATALDAILSRWRPVRVVVTVLALALTVFTFARGIRVLQQYKVFNDQALAEIAAAPSQAVLKERQFTSYSRFVKPMNFQSNNFFAHEIVWRAYCDKTNVQFVSDSLFARYHEGRLLDGAEPLPATCDRPDILGTAYTIPGQNYMAVELVADTLPATFQTARYMTGIDPDALLPDEERQRRHSYGIRLDYEPTGFFPLEYKGKNYLICSPPGTFIHQMVFPVDIATPPLEVTLTVQH